MNSSTQNQYTPDYVSPPGETLLEILEEQGMSQAELAQRTGRPKKTINEIIHARTVITPETAMQLERVLGISANFWNNREQQYRQYLARQEQDKRLRDQVGWLRRFPIKIMTERRWIHAFGDEVEQLNEVLTFFGVASPEQWEAVWSQTAVAFRKTSAFQSHYEDISVWLRRGELEARAIDCQPYVAEIFRQALLEIRPLTTQPPEIFQTTVVRLCAQGGVAVVFVPELPGAKVSGATRWLTPTKAMIQLSLRYKTDDHLWFTFFHEAGHILLHGKRDLFLEDDSLTGDKEREADEFAARILIPPTALSRFLQKTRPRISKQAIKDFAAGLGIAPGIVVGRLQHDGHLPYTHCNELKRSLAWPEATPR